MRVKPGPGGMLGKFHAGGYHTPQRFRKTEKVS